MNEWLLVACAYCESSSVFGPRGWGDYLVAGAAIVIVGWTLKRAVSLLLSPGENEPEHIKSRVLEGIDGDAEEA